jgi:hypothetical protein
MTSTPEEPGEQPDPSPVDATQPEGTTPADDDDSLIGEISEPWNRGVGSLVDDMREELGGPA